MMIESVIFALAIFFIGFAFAAFESRVRHVELSCACGRKHTYGRVAIVDDDHERRIRDALSEGCWICRSNRQSLCGTGFQPVNPQSKGVSP